MWRIAGEESRDLVADAFMMKKFWMRLAYGRDKAQVSDASACRYMRGYTLEHTVTPSYSLPSRIHRRRSVFFWSLYKCTVSSFFAHHHVLHRIDLRQDGMGTRKYSNGNLYEGRFSEGELSGEGTMRYANGCVGRLSPVPPD